MGKKTKIDWCDSSWNPVTGCLHGCEYCYARGIANRFAQSVEDCISENDDLFTQKWLPLYEEFIFRFHHQPWKVTANGKRAKSPYPCGFAPTFHEYRLDEPRHWEKPRTIFVCSMADLFGEWVPDEWIKAVFGACEAAPQHRYLFLTKNPARLLAMANAYLVEEWNHTHEMPHPQTAQYKKVLPLPTHDNWWFGTTITAPDEQYFFSAHHHCFVSIEPIFSPFDTGWFNRRIKWIIVGAETGNRKGKVIPEKSWLEGIERCCFAGCVPLFMKKSLRPIMGDDFRQEFPWEV